MDAVQNGSRVDFIIGKDGILMHSNRVCILKVRDLRKQIMEEAHCSANAMHPGSIKIYQIIKQSYWQNGIKREIAEFIFRCLVCEQIKVEHQDLARKLQLVPIPK